MRLRNQLGEISLDKREHMINPYPPGWEKSILPVGENHPLQGKCGGWVLDQFTVKDDVDLSLFNLRLIRDGERHRVVPPGTYKRLRFGSEIVMTDTPAEAIEHDKLLRLAHGKVLLNGLGMGWALQNILAKPEVEEVTVVEKSRDVIALVWPHLRFRMPRVILVCADAMEWRPPKGVKFQVVWHDIWSTISTDNLPDMHKLKRAYGKIAEWQGCWNEDLCRAMREYA